MVEECFQVIKVEAWCKIEEDKIMEREKFNTKVYRNEFKYMLTNQQLSLLKNRISEVMELDPHTPQNGRYLIHSLYFDNHNDESVYTTNSGLSERYKWRIRYYGDDKSFLVLEKKKKRIVDVIKNHVN